MTNLPSPPQLAWLDELLVVEVRGDDRTTWLQGQVTNDAHAFVTEGTMHAFHLDAQGKILAELHAIHVDESWFLVLEASVGRDVVKALDRRIIMEDVELRVRDDRAVVTTLGEDVSAIAEELRSIGAVDLRTRRFGVEAREWIVATETRERAFESPVAIVGSARLEADRPAAGRPRFDIDFGKTTLPQESGLHRETVSFVKGCYVGQEPVVMIEHRGKPPRRMCVVEASAALTLPAEVTRPDGSVVGRCTSLSDATGRHRGLALIKRADAVVGAELRAGDATLRVVSLVGEERNPST